MVLIPMIRHVTVCERTTVHFHVEPACRHQHVGRRLGNLLTHPDSAKKPANQQASRCNGSLHLRSIEDLTATALSQPLLSSQYRWALGDQIHLVKVVSHTVCTVPGSTTQVEHLALTPDVGRRVRALAAALEEAEGHHAVEASAQVGGF